MAMAVRKKSAISSVRTVVIAGKQSSFGYRNVTSIEVLNNCQV